MWDKTLRPHLGGVSLMRYALNFLAVLCAALLWTILVAPQTHAAPAEWQGGNLMMDGKSYEGPTTADREAAQLFGIPENSKYFQNLEGTKDDNIKKLRILYFGPGDELKDASSAQHLEFRYEMKGTDDVIDGRSDLGSVGVKKDTYESGGEKEATSCVVTGIGYIICPIMSLVADAVDKMFDVLKRFLEVKPISTDKDSGLFKAWSIMLSIANVLFVIGFLVIIYSYISNQGVSQYDLRTIIPRLIVAAALINLSYYICALAVDASNVIGANLQDAFEGIRKDITGNNVASQASWTWAGLTTLILSGGTIGAGVLALGAYGTAALHFLTPILITAAIALLVVVIVLAARQALIVVLIVAAPLAFAAFILPSTQKYFDKWKDLFVTMLMVYPLFSLLFGGSQLAAALIAQNASSAIMVLFAMFIQVVPLVLTPFLIKFSGGLLGRLAGMINNPTKGPLDRVKNWSRDKAGLAKDRRTQTSNALGARLARRLQDTKRHEENLKKKYDTMAQDRYARSERGKSMSSSQRLADDRLATANALNEAAYEEMKRLDPDVRLSTVQLKIANMQLDVNKAKAETYLKELESKKGADYYAAGGAQAEAMLGQSARDGDKVARALGSQVHKLAEESMVQASRQSMASAVHHGEYADHILANPSLAADAGGIKGETGANLALANATQTIRKDFGEGVAAQTELLKHFSKDLDNESLRDLALGGTAIGYDSHGRSYTFSASDIGGELHEAALAKFLQETNYEGAKTIIKAASDGGWDGVYGTVKESVIKMHGSKAPFLSGQSLDVIDQGKATSAGGYNNMIMSYIQKGKFSGQSLAGADASALEDMLKVMYAQKRGDTSLLGPEVTAFPPGFQMHVDELIETARKTLSDPQIASNISETNREKLRAMKNLGRLI